MKEMDASIVIEKSGLLDTIQDAGRFGYQQYGMVVSGAMDTYSYRLANILLGNQPSESCIEFTLVGPAVRFTYPTVIALTGGHYAPRLNGLTVPMWQCIEVQEGDLLTIGAADMGCRGYLAVRNGFKVDRIHGSRSTYLKGQMGGWEGRALQKGDVIPYTVDESLEHSQPSSKSFGRKWAIPYRYRVEMKEGKEDIQVRVILGPQEDAFSAKGIDTLFASSYMISPQMDRMGLRLEGAPIEHCDQADILSDSIPFGAIQVPANGQPIILMADRQTTGGYTKIGTVISVDLPKIAQARPGQRVSFQRIDLSAAQKLLRQQEGFFKVLHLLSQ